MTSYTGKIISPEYATVASKTGISFTSGKTYTMQIQGSAWLKEDDAEFLFSNREFQYKASSSDLYIKTTEMGCLMTFLEEKSQ